MPPPDPRSQKYKLPETTMSAPAAFARRAVAGVIPPSTSIIASGHFSPQKPYFRERERQKFLRRGAGMDRKHLEQRALSRNTAPVFSPAFRGLTKA